MERHEPVMFTSGPFCAVWFDPGGSTGWAAYQCELLVSPETPFDMSRCEFYNPQITQGQLGPEEHHAPLWYLLGQLHCTNYVVGMESFEYRQDQRAKVVLVSKEYIGIAKLYTQDRNETLPPRLKVKYMEQDPATGKSFWYPKVAGKKDAWDGSRLKALGLYTPTTNGRHINDATAHLLRWLVDGPFKQQWWLRKLHEMGL